MLDRSVYSSGVVRRDVLAPILPSLDWGYSRLMFGRLRP
jgi:hypothetical protein